jgi:hypothetical protein
VIAYGELTGHSHTIAETDAQLLQFADGNRYLLVNAPVYLRHEEHLPLALPVATFKVVIQREYVPGPVPSYRHVAD